MAVPLDTPSSPQSQRVLRNLEAEKKREAEERITGWAVVWTLFGFKMATVIVIWFAAKGSPEANAYIAVTTWYWLFIPVVAVSGFIAYRWRLRQVRKRLDELRTAEFMRHRRADEPVALTDEDVRILMALDLPRGERDRPGEG